MINKGLVSALFLAPILAGNSFSSSILPSATLEAALSKIDKTKVQCYCVCEFNGKTQLAAGVQMAKLFEQELAENEAKENVFLSDYFDGLIGISTGALVAAPLALGQNASDIEALLPSLESKLIVPNEVSGCFACLGKSVQVASYFVDGDVAVYNDEDRLENNYDAIKMNSKAISGISNIISGTEHDLKSCLTLLSTSSNPDFSEQVIAAIQESDNAAKKNTSKIMFDTLLDTAKVVTSGVIEVAGDQINKSAATKALEIMTKTEEVAENVNDTLDNTLFKRNLAYNIANPSAEKPIVIVDFRAQTGAGRAIKTGLSQDIQDNFIKLTYTTEIPLGLYPTKKQAFDSIKPSVDSSVTNCMQSIRLDTAVCTDLITDFLTAVKIAKSSIE